MASVAPYWLCEWKALPPGQHGSIHIAEREMELPLTPFPPLAEVERERAEWAATLNAVRQRNAPEWERNVAERFDHWWQARLDATRSGADPRTIRFAVQVLRWNELTLVGIPFETMVETGLQLCVESSQANTFVLGYRNYLVPSEVPGDWEPAIRRAALELIEDTLSR